MHSHLIGLGIIESENSLSITEWITVIHPSITVIDDLDVFIGEFEANAEAPGERIDQSGLFPLKILFKWGQLQGW